VLTSRLKTIKSHELMQYFTRDGIECPYGVWAEALADSGYRELQVDELPNGLRVETIWLGVDGHSFYLKPRRIDRPLIFYTTIKFPKSGRSKRRNKYFRYATEREAWAGHRAALRKYVSASKRLRRRAVPRS
jgi:hypothetical protein